MGSARASRASNRRPRRLANDAGTLDGTRPSPSQRCSRSATVSVLRPVAAISEFSASFAFTTIVIGERCRHSQIARLSLLFSTYFDLATRSQAARVFGHDLTNVWFCPPPFCRLEKSRRPPKLYSCAPRFPPGWVLLRPGHALILAQACSHASYPSYSSHFSYQPRTQNLPPIPKSPTSRSSSISPIPNL